MHRDQCVRGLTARREKACWRDLKAKTERKGAWYKMKLEMQVGARTKLVQDFGPRGTFQMNF